MQQTNATFRPCPKSHIVPYILLSKEQVCGLIRCFKHITAAHYEDQIEISAGNLIFFFFNNYLMYYTQWLFVVVLTYP